MSKAELVSSRNLIGILDKAVAAAAERAGVTDAGPLIRRWEIYGRYLRDLKAAEPFAQHVADSVNKAGVAAHPSVLVVDGKILAGFIERASLPAVQEL